MFDQLLADALTKLATCTNVEQLQEFHATYLGKNGLVSAQYKTLKDLDPEAKKAAGPAIQALQQQLEQAFFTQQEQVKHALRDKEMAETTLDRSTPVDPKETGKLTLMSQMRRHVEDVFRSMGFHIEYGHHVVTQRENFQSVNIPASHPATEMHDTLYLKDTDEEGKKYVLRTHTSAHQVDLIKKFGVPCKFIIPGKVYRNEKMDASHDCVFWQLEGVVIDEGISIAHFKSLMTNILEGLLEQTGVEIRMRPAYFPFVEPGFEIDAKFQLGKKNERVELL
jgi:phenylalanyl-tRNA synthetase alpha chain